MPETAYLTQTQSDRFFRLWHGLLRFVNKRDKILARFPATARGLAPDEVSALQAALYEDPDHFDGYIRKNPDKLDKDDLGMVHGWRYGLAGAYAIMDHRADGAIFMDAQFPMLRYLVLGVSQPIQELARKTPAVVEATLLPFEGRIIHTGVLVSAPRVPRDITRMLKDAYRVPFDVAPLRTTIETPATGAPDPRVEIAQLHSAMPVAAYREHLQAQNPLFVDDAMAVLADLISELAVDYDPPVALLEMFPEDLAEWAADRSDVERDTVAGFLEFAMREGMVDPLEGEMLLGAIGRGTMGSVGFGGILSRLMGGFNPDSQEDIRALIDNLQAGAGRGTSAEQQRAQQREAAAADSGGVPIPKAMQAGLIERIERVAQAEFAGRYTRLDCRFKGKFCYIDAYTEPDLAPDWPPADWGETHDEMAARLRETPTHLCRLRYFGGDRWGWAFYTYSNERYELSVFPNGEFYGQPEDAFRAAANAYL